MFNKLDSQIMFIVFYTEVKFKKIKITITADQESVKTRCGRWLGYNPSSQGLS